MSKNKKKDLMNKNYLTLMIYFICTRMLMVLFGFEILVDYSYMHFHDVGLITQDFWETIFYTHAFTPWINMLAGFVLLFPSGIQTEIYQVIFYSFSFASIICFFRILSRLSISDYFALGITIFFSLTPAFIYFEHFLSYTFPSMTMLLILINGFDIALKKDNFKSWLVFFSLCVLLCFIRTTFHYIWLIAVLVGTLLLVKKLDYKLIGAFCIPATFLIGWYLKNLIVFGFFGASSWAGFNLAFTTTRSLSPDEVEILIDQKTLSPLAAIPIYSNIEAYADHINLSTKTGVAVLDQKTKPSITNSTNFNHKSFIELSRAKMNDNLSFISHFPVKYFKRVLAGHVQFFGPSTRWHPHDEDRSPHIPLRKKIGEWEYLYNQVIHFSTPLKRMGLYLILGLPLAFYFFKSILMLLKWKTFSHDKKIHSFLIMNIFYVMLLSCLVTIGELARYRFMIEPFIWILITLFIKSLLHHPLTTKLKLCLNIKSKPRVA